MTQSQKITMLETMTGKTDSTLLSTYLTISAEKIRDRLYPFADADYDSEECAIPTKYDTVQVEIAAYLINKIGAEGETRHSENGVDRTYETADVPRELLRRIIPIAKVVGVS